MTFSENLNTLAFNRELIGQSGGQGDPDHLDDADEDLEVRADRWAKFGEQKFQTTDGERERPPLPPELHRGL